MGATQSPFSYVEAGHPFTGLPLDIIQQVGNSGAGGTYRHFDHFTNYTGPVGDGTLNGIVMTSVNTGRVDFVAQTTNVENSVIRIVSDGTDLDNTCLEWRQVPMFYELGKQMWVFAHFAIENVDLADVVIGLATSFTDFKAGVPADGLYLSKLETATDFGFTFRQDGAGTINADDLSLTMTDGVFVTLGFHVNTAGTITPYSLNTTTGAPTAGTAVAAGTANIPDATDGSDIMTPHIWIESGDGSENYVALDWFLVVKER